MKKTLFILPAFLFAFAATAQIRTEARVGLVPTGKTFGEYKGTAIIIPETDRTAKPVDVKTITGIVVKVEWCEDDCRTLWVKKDDGTTVAIGTKDNGFTVPKELVGRRINVEATTPASLISGRKRKTVRNNYQQDIQFSATGIKVID